jgi:hypothetical protein
MGPTCVVDDDIDAAAGVRLQMGRHRLEVIRQQIRRAAT